MTDSILTSVKKTLGLDANYTAFDPEIVIHINSVLSTLTQLGVGPVNGLTIEDDSTTWAEFIAPDSRLNAVKSYVYLRVRLLFDPPGMSYLISSMENQVKELEWRLNLTVETEDVLPTSPDTAYLVVPIEETS